MASLQWLTPLPPSAPGVRVNPTAMSLKAGCALFLRYTTRTSALELSEFDMAKSHLIEVQGRDLSEGEGGRVTGGTTRGCRT